MDEKYCTPEIFCTLIGAPYSVIAKALFPDAIEVGCVALQQLQAFGYVSSTNDSFKVDSKIASKNKRGLHVTKLLHAPSAKLLFGCMDHALPAEQALAWTFKVLGTLKPKKVLIVSSIIAMNYRGPGDSSSEDLVFRLDTESYPKTSTQVSMLPSSTAIDGIPAAMLQTCEFGNSTGSERILPCVARIICAVEHSQIPPTSLVLRASNSLLETLKELTDLQNLPEIQRYQRTIEISLDKLYQNSAGNSIFI